MKRAIFLISGLIICFSISTVSDAAQRVVAQKVEKAPLIDGKDTDPVWAKAKAIVTRDKVANIDITLKAVYTDKEIFFLVSFPDPNESRTHKSWVWNKAREIYEMGNDREDTFIFKWNMEKDPVNLSIYADNPYKSDIWFWKACRTDPVGYADDKIDILSPLKGEVTEDSTDVKSKTGKVMYLLRRADKGDPAFKTKLQVKYEGDVVPRFTYQTPIGSIADVKAKGVWKDRRWIIEFGRALNTGNDDDVQFDITKSYQFGVSRFEIAGRGVNPELNQPLYGAGDVSEELVLVFGNAD